jgi:hypothetical protein
LARSGLLHLALNVYVRARAPAPDYLVKCTNSVHSITVYITANSPRACMHRLHNNVFASSVRCAGPVRLCKLRDTLTCATYWTAALLHGTKSAPPQAWTLAPVQTKYPPRCLYSLYYQFFWKASNDSHTFRAESCWKIQERNGRLSGAVLLRLASTRLGLQHAKTTPECGCCLNLKSMSGVLHNQISVCRSLSLPLEVSSSWPISIVIPGSLKASGPLTRLENVSSVYVVLSRVHGSALCCCAKLPLGDDRKAQDSYRGTCYSEK